MNKRYFPCDLCGSEEYTVLFKDELGDAAPTLDYNFCPDTMKTYQIVRCNSCSLVYLNPMPILAELYEDVVDESYIRTKKQLLLTSEKCIQDILKFKQGGSLLDIGCSIGVFLDAASKYFYVEGVETSRWAYNEAIKRHKVYNKPLSELNLKKTYDIVTLFGVIEHFENPTKELLSVYNILKPGGLLIIYTGDVSAWLPRLLGKKWWWFQGMHTFYFSKATCQSLLEKCGFEVVKAKTYTRVFQLSLLGMTFQRYRIGKVIKPVLDIPLLKEVQIPLKVSGEMILFAFKK